jgi:hypothetical protein
MGSGGGAEVVRRSVAIKRTARYISTSMEEKQRRIGHGGKSLTEFFAENMPSSWHPSPKSYR